MEKRLGRQKAAPAVSDGNWSQLNEIQLWNRLTNDPDFQAIGYKLYRLTSTISY